MRLLGYLIAEFIICPLRDRWNGYDFEAYKNALEQDRIRRSYEGE